MATKSRSWTAAEASEHLAAFDRSESSLTAFAEQLGISPQRIYYWRHRLRAGQAPAVTARLLEVTVRHPPIAPVAEICFPTGHAVKVTGLALSDVLRAVAELAC